MASAFGPYVLLGEIARGGMAEVHYAVHTGTSEPLLALKRILPHFTADESFRRFFSAESLLTRSMNHANVVKAVDTGESDGAPFLVMEYIHGRATNRVLSQLASLGKRLPIPYAVYVAVQALEGLDYVHRTTDSQGRPLDVVLSDVSPGNLMLGYDGTVKLIDFGIATSRMKFFEQIGYSKGKKTYMAPEQLRGLPMDHRADIFAMGTCLLELLSSKTAFSGFSEFEIEEMVRSARLPPVSALVKNPPPGFEEVVKRSLCASREERYPTAASFADALRPYARLGRGRQVDAAAMADLLKLLIPDLIHSDDARLLQVQDLSRTIAARPEGSVNELETEPPTQPRNLGDGQSPEG
jgi:serine/threonine-protein kinase